MSAPQAIIVTDSGQVDVTEEVKTVLDRLASSLDWGSGFLCADDIEAWATIAAALDMDVKGLDAEIADLRENDRVRALLDSKKVDIKKEHLYQIRTSEGSVVEEFISALDTISWERPPRRRTVFNLWQNYGAGWRDLGRWPT